MNKKELKKLLDKEYELRNSKKELNKDKPDPLLVARKYMDEKIILTCALFAYGNAKQIVKFLNKLPFDLIDRPVSENTIREKLKGLKYRFQNEEDIIQWFLILKEIRNEEKSLQKGREPKESMIYKIILKEYEESKDIIKSIKKVITYIYSKTKYNSKGLEFLIGRIDTKSPLKRWNMFMRWMVRKDNLDLGYWKEISPEDLIIPLDTNLFNIGKKLGLIKRKSYDLQSAIEITNNLKNFNEKDPLKYDFVLYRIGQEKLLKEK